MKKKMINACFYVAILIPILLVSMLQKKIPNIHFLSTFSFVIGCSIGSVLLSNSYEQIKTLDEKVLKMFGSFAVKYGILNSIVIIVSNGFKENGWNQSSLAIQFAGALFPILFGFVVHAFVSWFSLFRLKKKEV